jgi:PAS domain S-box-containing protein
MLEDRTGEIMAHEENALLADLVNASPTAITVSDFSGNFLYSNKKNLDLHGYSLSEFLDLNLGQLDITKSAKPLAERLEGLKKSGEASFEVVHSRKDGQQVPLEVHAKIARWGDRWVVLSIATDISERKQAEQVLRESERRFADIIDFLPDATFVVNREGTVIAWNRAIEEMTGVKACDIVGRRDYAYAIAIHGKHRPVLLDLIFKDDPEVRKHYWHLQKEGSTFTAETVLTPPGAGERFVWLKASPFYDRDGRITGAIESIRDITERKRAVQELRESEHKFATVFQSNPISLTLVSATDGVFVDVNDTFSINSGYAREEVIGKTPEELGLFADTAAYAQIVSPIRNQRDVQGMEVPCRTKSGEIRTCRFSSGVIMMGGKPHILLTVEDITERKDTESAFQAMVTGMVGTTGMDSLDRITESISTWLGADCIMIGEIAPDKKHVQVLSMLLDGKKIADYSYTLKGTPCENTAEKGFCMYPDEVLKLFPESRDLHKFNIRGYAGTPLRNFEGQVVGILGILTRKPLILPPSAREIIDIIAVKAAAEIGRRNAVLALHESERKFRTIFESSPYPIAINSYPENKFLEVNAAFLSSSGFTEKEILGKNQVELGLLSLMDSAKLGARRVMVGKLENVPLALTGKGGRRVHVQFSAIPITINDRRVIVTVAAEVTKLKRVEEELHQQNLVLETINQIALEFASLPKGKSVPQQAVKSLMKLSGAVMTLFLVYDPSDRTLQVTNFEIAPGMLEKIIQLLGKLPGDVKSPVSTDMYREMVSTIIGKRKTLTEVSFGQIPPLVSMSIQKLMSIDRFIAIAYVIEGELYGTSILAMKAGQPDPSPELLKSFAHIVAISLRRDRDEPGT